MLVGSARGGTSWALKVLDAHPLICGCHEPFVHAADPGFLELVKRLKSDGCDADDVREFLTSAAMPRLQTQKPPFFGKQFLTLPAFVRSGLWTAAKMSDRLEVVFRLASRGALDARHYLAIKNRPFDGLEQIMHHLRAKALILVRHPCAVVSSWRHGIQIGAMPQTAIDPVAVWPSLSTQLEPLGFTQVQLSRMSPLGILALNWLSDQVMFRRFESGPLDSHVLVYEDVVDEPAPRWRAAYEWLGLPYDRAVERFLDDSSRSGFDLRTWLGDRYSYFSVKRAKNSTLDTWKQKLQPAEIDEILNLVRPHVDLARYWPQDA